jgi:HD superfamily phosphodiesterase
LLRLAGTEGADGKLAVDGSTLHDLYDGVLMYALLPHDDLAAAIVRARRFALE